MKISRKYLSYKVNYKRLFFYIESGNQINATLDVLIRIF